MNQLGKMSGLVISVTPDGKTKMGERDRLMIQFKNNTLTPVNKKRLLNFLIIEKRKPKYHLVPITFNGKTKMVRLTREEYLRFKNQ